MSTSLKKESYLVEGMTCSGCERAIQKVISNLQGVTAANADMHTSTVSVCYDPSLVNIEQIKSAIMRIGYKFVGERPPHGQKEGRDDGVS